jgi:hypothetical protein
MILTMCRVALALLLLLAATGRTDAAGTPAAQSQPMITLFSQPGFKGPSVQLIVPAANLQELGFANRTISFIVQSGTWQLCAAPNWTGHCITVQPGKYPAGFSNGFSRTLISLQPVVSKRT